MKVFSDAGKFGAWCAARRKAGKRIALVPTMGCLHAGHLSLVAEARRRRAQEIAVSIFVNPTQFGPNEDFAKYPRVPEADLAKCRAAGVTAVFMPPPEALYSPDHSVWVVEDGALSGSLCGARRPGHFRGVCTGVAKLFNLAKPHFAVFGQKDFQQATIIRRMVRDLNFDLEVVMAPIVREPSGLALSSRNLYLSDSERASALALSASLKELRAALAAAKGKPLRWAPLRRRVVSKLEKAGLKVDYVEAVSADDLAPSKTLAPGVAVLLAAFAGKTRLIDNAIF